MHLAVIKKVTIGMVLMTILSLIIITIANAGGGKDRDPKKNSGRLNITGLTPATLIRGFGSKAQIDRLDRIIADRINKLDKAYVKNEKLKSELEEAKEKLRKLARKIKADGGDMETENEYFSAWRDAIHKQYAYKKNRADVLIGERNVDLAKAGLEPVSKSRENKFRKKMKAHADKLFVANQVKFADKVMKYGDGANDEADERDRQIMRWTMVKYASMAGSAGLSGVAIVVKAGQVGIAALSAAEATKLLSISAAIDLGGAGIGAAADSHYSGKSATESFVRGLSAAGVQALAGKILGKPPENATAARNFLVEFAQSGSVDQLQSALQTIPDNLKKKSSSSPSPSAPNYDPPVYKQQHAM